jgi:hypothetical protein
MQCILTRTALHLAGAQSMKPNKEIYDIEEDEYVHEYYNVLYDS